jgi:integrase
MASIGPRRPDGTYRARYRDASGKEHAKHFRRKADAQRWLDEVTASVVTGTYVDPRAGRVTFREAAMTYIGSAYLRPESHRTYGSYLRNHILPVFGERQLRSITPSEVRGFIRAKQDVLAPTTVTAVYNLMAAIFNAAVLDGTLGKSPCVKAQPVKGKAQPFTVLEPAQVWALADAMPARWRVGVLIAAGCGLRVGETLGLRMHRIDFLRRELSVEEQLVRRKGEGLVLAPPKTKTSRAVVPVPTFALEALAEHVRTYPRGMQDFLLEGVPGQPVQPTSYWPAFRAAVRRAGLTAETSPHDLRHFTATAMINQGEHVKKVQKVMRHGSATETLDVYAGHWPELEDRRTAGLDAAMGDPADHMRTAGLG